MGGASFHYGISRDEKSEIFGAIKPMEYVSAILAAMGQLECDQSSCQKKLFMPCNFVKGENHCRVHDSRIKYNSSVACCFWPKQDIFETSEVLNGKSIQSGPSRILI